MNRVTLAIVLLFGTALLLYWQVQSKRGQQEVAVDISARPDYIINDLKSVEFNEEGLINSKVSAAHMEHYEETNVTYFTQPIYLLYPDDGQAQWRIQSAQGTLNKNSGKVVLEDNVIIDAISPEEPIQTIKTSYIELDLNTMIMISDRDIYVTGNDFVIKGVGLYGELNEHKVKLTSNVEGRYSANQ